MYYAKDIARLKGIDTVLAVIFLSLLFIATSLM
jgi:hypothetical protein